SFGQRRALGDTVEEQYLGLAITFAFEIRHRRFVGSERSQLLEQCGRSLTGRIKANGNRHQLLCDRLVGGLGGDSGDVRAQAARRSKAGELAVGSEQTLRLQRGLERSSK